MSQQVLLLFIAVIIVLYFMSILSRSTADSSSGSSPLLIKAILGISVLSLLTLILPWVNLPLIGSVNGLELLSSSFSNRINETSLSIMISIGILSLVNIIGSIIQLKSSTSKKSFTKNFEILTGLLYIIIGYISITQFKSFWSASSGDLFGRALSMTTTIGFGLYLLIFLGVLQIIVIFTIKK